MTSSSSKPKKTLKVLHISDIHFFHPRNPTHEIIDKLKEQLFNEPIDLMLFSGDIFDNLASLSVDSVYDVMDFARTLTHWAIKTNTPVRILKGTPRHDWKQNKIFASIAKSMRTELVQTKDELEIEYIPSLGVNVLYIPDEYRPTTTETQALVEGLLKQHKLEQVDIVSMHGAFDYQLGGYSSPEYLHSSAYYESITKYFVSVGHIHQSSQNGNIIAQGSYDRLCHGDEGTKGFFITTIHRDKGTIEPRFIPNTKAKVFLTIDVTQMDTEDAIKELRSVALRIPFGSYIRILALSTSQIYQGYQSLAKEFKDHHWSRKAFDNNKKPTRLKAVLTKYESLVLSKDNIAQLSITKAMHDSDTLLDTTILESLMREAVEVSTI